MEEMLKLSVLGLLVLLSPAVIKRQWVIYGIIAALFLEAHIFSFCYFGARIRIAQVIALAGLVSLLFLILMNRLNIKKTPLDVYIWLYLFINFFSVANSLWARRAVKISLLLLSLALLYYLFVNFVDSRELFNKAFRLLLWAGIIEVVYGLYQVLAGMCNWAFGFNLPVGHLGMVHCAFIGSPWGRPYGTFVEPDWYGIICMFYLLLFITLYYSKTGNRKGYLFCMLISLLGLFFSFVRSAWLGFMGGIIFLLFYRNKSSLSMFNLFLCVRKLYFLACPFFIMVLISPHLRVILRERFHSDYLGSRPGLENVRVKQMAVSFRAFLKHPALGNGPGSAAFDYLADRYGIDGAEEIISDNKLPAGRAGFSPGIISTVMEDTGLIGLIVFIALIIRILSYNLKMIPALDNDYSLKALGLLSGMAGLFISYLFTQGFWLPFTWVFLGFNIAILRIGIRHGYNGHMI